MTDQELLEMAAKAVGINSTWCQFPGMIERHGLDGAIYDEVECEYWNPLKDGGDALRLAVQLQLSINICKSYTIIYGDFPDQDFLVDECPRRGIVRAAAEIGKSMEKSQ